MIQTATLQGIVQGKHGFGEYVWYENELTPSVLLKHFSCPPKLSDKGVRKSHGEAILVSESFLYGTHPRERTTTTYNTTTQHHHHHTEALCSDRATPILASSSHSDLLVLDLENARFSKEAFWALPIKEMDAYETQVWSKIVLHTFQMPHDLVLLSNVKVKLFSSVIRSSNFFQLNDTVRNSSLHGKSFTEAVSSMKVSKKDVLSWVRFLNTESTQQTQSSVVKDVDGRYQNSEAILDLYNATCFSLGTDVQLGEPWVQFRTIVLVVLFNNPFYHVIPYLELLYRPFFPTMIYCMPKDKHQRGQVPLNVTILHYESAKGSPGATNYICVHMVSQLRLPAQGFFFLSDDILVSLSLLKDFPLQLPAISIRYPNACDIQRPSFRNCDHWLHFRGSSVSLKSIYKKYGSQLNSLPYNCLKKLQNATGFKEPLLHALADIYYIPNKYMEEASSLFKIFHEHKVYLEAAVKYVLTCLTLPQYPIEMQGHHDWSRNRDLFYRSVHLLTSEKTSYLHPAKLSAVVKHKEKFVWSFCKELIPYLHRGY